MLARDNIRGPHALALRAFRRMPTWMRVFIVRRVAPAHTVGALCFVEHEGRVLLLRQRHRRGWTLPGGLVNRGETAVQAVEREVFEETGLSVSVGQPFATVIEPGVRRVDVLFRVTVEHRPDVIVAGEALNADWLRPEDAGPVDEPTTDAFRERRRFLGGGSHDGQLTSDAAY
jgi:ADP-ribose pyrophosphatase YjhB (NUDIX family)